MAGCAVFNIDFLWRCAVGWGSLVGPWAYSAGTSCGGLRCIWQRHLVALRSQLRFFCQSLGVFSEDILWVLVLWQYEGCQLLVRRIRG